MGPGTCVFKWVREGLRPEPLYRNYRIDPEVHAVEPGHTGCQESTLNSQYSQYSIV